MPLDEDKLRVVRALREPEARRSEFALGQLQQEIAGEMAASLGRAYMKAETTHAAFVAADAQNDGSPAAVARRQEAHRAATEAVWELTVHREAVGMRDHGDIPSRFPLPGR